MARKRICVVHTGGTIGMKRSGGAWSPAPGYVEQQLCESRLFHRDEVPDWVVEDLEPLLDSADMVPTDWLRIARRIEQRLPAFDGIVVLHGTDTMAYTASALSFMLEHLDKPVILTGSQVPLSELRTDAWRNLLTSMLIAAGEPLPEVAVYFGDALYRGNRTVKTDCFGFDAFASPNYPILATAGVSIEVHRSRVRVAGSGNALVLHEHMAPHVGGLWLFPGITAEIVHNFLLPPLRAAVIQAYGVGNGPASNPAILAAFREASERGVVLVDCTQCLTGRVQIEDYATGRGLAGAGLVSGHDMTHEAALTKLSYLIGRGYAPDEVRRQVGEDLRGELTLPVEG